MPVFTEAMTRHMVVEWGQHGIRVMCVAPGPIEDTEGARRLGQYFAHMKNQNHIRLCNNVWQRNNSPNVGLFLGTVKAISFKLCMLITG